ncbi:hypothetical protein F5Y14DRAFT_403443 [Nemania sp. NC0429]|nr:hypothetical protein F5Y14DRAFT_403443 [Nemania sp. NC0429]
MTARLLILSTSRAGLGGARLTHIQPKLRISSLLIDISRDISAPTWRQSGITLKRSLTAGGARLLSSSSNSTPAKKDGATSSASQSGPPSQSGRGDHQSSSPSEDHFAINFRDLGMNRITKFVVFTVIGVLGTMETIFWCKVLWRWWTGEQEEESE